MPLRTVIPIAVPLVTIALMIVVGSDLQPGDFRRLARRARVVWVGLLVPPLALPPLALGVIALLQPPRETAAGLLLIAACPVGGISNTFSYLARASTALSVTLTGLSCLLAVITLPALGTALPSAAHLELGLRVPVGWLLMQLLVTVAAPVSIGMGIRVVWPRETQRLRPAMARLSFVLLGLLLALIIFADLPAFVAALPHAVPLAAVFVVACFAVGGGVGHLLGASVPNRTTLAIEFATRNVAVATTVAVTVLGHVEFATFGTAYFLTELPLMTAAALVCRTFADRASSAVGTVPGT